MNEKHLSKLEIQQAPSAELDTKVYESIRAALADARTKVVVAVNTTMVGVYWEIGRQIAEAVGERAEYGRSLLAYLSERLTAEFGKGFTDRNLRAMRQFYEALPIRHTLRAELSWSHYRLLINENLFASKYRLYLPTEEELRLELQRERELIERQIKESHDGDDE